MSRFNQSLSNLCCSQVALDRFDSSRMDIKPDLPRPDRSQNANSGVPLASFFTVRATKDPAPISSYPIITSHPDASNTFTKSQSPSDSYSNTGENIPRPIMVSPVGRSADDLSLLRHRRENLEPLRNDFQMAAIDYKKERAMIFRYAEHLKGLKNELVQSVESLISVVREGPVQRIKEELNNLSPNIDSCIHGMQLEDQKCSLIEDRIADLLYRVSKIEGQMCPGLENHLHHVQPSEYPPRTDSATSQYQMVDDSIYPTPAIVEELYSRMGDYKNYMEELHNFEWELREALDERESLRANPNVNLVSDEEFFKEQKGLRAQLIENLDLAQADVTRLRQQCINDGIPFEDGLGFPIIPFNTGNESHAQTSTHTSAMGILPLDPANASPESIIGGFFDTQNRVADWIEDTPEGYHEPHPSSEGAVDKTGDLSDLDIISELSWEAPRLPSSPPDVPSATSNDIPYELPKIPTFRGPYPPSSGDIELSLRTPMS